MWLSSHVAFSDDVNYISLYRNNSKIMNMILPIGVATMIRYESNRWDGNIYLRLIALS